MEQHAASGGENFDLREILLRGRRLDLKGRTDFFSDWIRRGIGRGDSMHLRLVSSAADREVEVLDRHTGKPRRMLMFGSNNYLGLANHPYVKERVAEALHTYGAGVGGPPLLNGYTALHDELEARLSALKGTEDTVLFHSGYGANVGLVSCLADRHDTVIYDAYCHASFHDGLKMTSASSAKFAHNDTEELAQLLEAADTDGRGDLFVGVEGAYSMDGDTAPLDEVARLCQKHGAHLIVDDAHGTGVTGPSGAGTAKAYGVSDAVAVNWGTFSKAFGVVGGFVSTSQAIADYMRFFARSYVFSASLPPQVVAAVLAGLDLLEREPQIHARLWENIRYTAEGLRRLGFDIGEPETAIIPLHLPMTMNIRRAAFRFHKMGIFLNTIEYPAVPVSKQRFRISLMATHTKADIDRLLECVEEVWDEFAPEESGGDASSRPAEVEARSAASS